MPATEVDEYFSFQVNDKTYVLPRKTKEVVNPGWVRLNRRRDEADYFMTMLESLCAVGAKVDKEVEEQGRKILEMLDSLDWPTHRRIQEELRDHLGATLGE